MLHSDDDSEACLHRRQDGEGEGQSKIERVTLPSGELEFLVNQSPIWLAVVKTIPQHLLSLQLRLLLCESAAGCRPEVGGGPDGLAGLSSSVFVFCFFGVCLQISVCSGAALQRETLPV